MPKKDKFYKVLFYPEKIEVKVKAKETIYQAIISAGINIHSVCGGEGTCGKCKVIVLKGSYQNDSVSSLSSEEIKKGYLLACQTHILSNMKVEIPEETRVKE